MQIRVGYELIYDCPQPTPMMLIACHLSRCCRMSSKLRLEIGRMRQLDSRHRYRPLIKSAGRAPLRSRRSRR